MRSTCGPLGPCGLTLDYTAYYPLYNAESLLSNSKLLKTTDTYCMALTILKARNTETNISSDHTLECPHRFLQEKGHCKTIDYIP